VPSLFFTDAFDFTCLLHKCGAGFKRDPSFRSCSYLGSENGRLNELERAAVDLDQALSGLGVGDSLSISNNSQHFCESLQLHCLVAFEIGGPGSWETNSRISLLAEALN
jgi:hypothetical protein